MKKRTRREDDKTGGRWRTRTRGRRGRNECGVR
jgi:hypothetical protein